MQTATETRLIDENDTAHMIGMSVPFLRLGRSEGHRGNRTSPPRHIKIGRSVRYDIRDVEAWIDAHRVNSGQATPKAAPALDMGRTEVADQQTERHCADRRQRHPADLGTG